MTQFDQTIDSENVQVNAQENVQENTQENVQKIDRPIDPEPDAAGDQVPPSELNAWRRGYATPPPRVEIGDERHPAGDPRYRDVPVDALPATECLADVVARVVPYWEDAIVPDLLVEGARGGVVLVVAHGNSLRALRKHIDGISDEDIVELEVPTGIPFRYRLGDDLSVVSSEYLGDPEAAKAASEAVARQAG